MQKSVLSRVLLAQLKDTFAQVKEESVELNGNNGNGLNDISP